jgi:hypothetical protein
MQIQIDTREHKKELKRIQGQFDELGVDYFTSKLYVGDYMNLDNPRLVIDRKKDLLELCGNVCQQHERFRAELVRAMDHDIRIIILVEHGEDITCLEDVFFWENPRTKPSQWVMKDGHPVKVPIQGGGIQGKQLFKSLCTIRDRYKVQFRFCTKDKTGAEIVRLLGGGKEWLRQRRDG